MTKRELIQAIEAVPVPDETRVIVYDPGDSFNYGSPCSIKEMFEGEDPDDVWLSVQDAQDQVNMIPVDAEDDEVPVLGELKSVLAIRIGEWEE